MHRSWDGKAGTGTATGRGEASTPERSFKGLDHSVICGEVIPLNAVWEHCQQKDLVDCDTVPGTVTVGRTAEACDSGFGKGEFMEAVDGDSATGVLKEAFDGDSATGLFTKAFDGGTDGDSATALFKKAFDGGTDGCNGDSATGKETSGTAMERPDCKGVLECGSAGVVPATVPSLWSGNCPSTYSAGRFAFVTRDLSLNFVVLFLRLKVSCTDSMFVVLLTAARDGVWRSFSP